MKISEVTEITGLTKKAINYYIQEGLINPETIEQNNYREFSREDVDKLAQISVLRQFDVPIKDIKEIINSPEQMKAKLEMHLNLLDEETKRLEKSKSVLKTCLNGFDKAELSHVTNQLSLLYKTLEMDQRHKEGFVKKQIQRIFPGNFGKMLAISYGPFLDEPVDSREKEEAWLSMVKFLDEVEDIEYPDEVNEVYKDIPEEEIEKYEKSYTENIDKWVKITDDGIMKEKKRLVEHFAENSENSDMQKEQKKVLKITQSVGDLMKNMGYSEGFSKNLKILSGKYAVYIQKMVELTKSLNIQLDENGKMVAVETKN